MLAAPRSHGSMLAAKPSSDSERLKPRVPGPISAPGGNWKPVMAYLAGSCEVRVYRPDRINDIDGLKELAPPPPDATTGAAAGGGLGAGVAGAAACGVAL